MAAPTSDLTAGLEGFAGDLLLPDGDGYDEARRIHNGMIDKRPRLIARCHGVADVVAAVNLGREEGVELSVRGGGHNPAGNAVTDGGLMIDLSQLKGIHVDPVRRNARAQGGVTWGELNRETQLHGLAVTGGTISTTGIAGLTLGGGLGLTMGKLGLATDNLLSAEIVTADGRVRTASSTENADLFWAIRGGGGNFGVVTSFEYRLHPVGPTVIGGVVVHPYSAAVGLLRLFRDLTATASDDLSLFAGLMQTPDGSGEKLCGLVLCHLGSHEQAALELESVRSFGSPLDVQLGPTPYTVVNTLVDGAFPRGALNYWKSSFLRELSDTAIEILVECFAACPSMMSVMAIEHLHGEVTRVPVEATAVPHRSTAYNLVIPSLWSDPAETEANIAWTRETMEAMSPFFADARYVNYLDHDDGGNPVRSAYGPNYERLAELKAKYDPENLFRLNQNIPPAARGPATPTRRGVAGAS